MNEQSDHVPPVMDRLARLCAARAAMDEAACGALVVTKAANIRWLTGFTGSSGMVVITPQELTVITDGRYSIQLAGQLEAAGVEAKVEINRDVEAPLVSTLAGIDRIALESENVTWAQQRTYARWLGGERLVPTDDLIETLRRVKDDGELDCLRRAAAIADGALAAIRPELSRQLSERQVAALLDRTMGELGADGCSFPTIVASGPNSARPHATPTDRRIVSGDLLVIDFGASVDGYGSDMTRSFSIGPPTEEQTALFDAVIDAQKAGVAAVRSGVEAAAVDRVCRDHLAQHGLAEAFVHGTGHGIGLEIHEQPILSARTSETLQSGYVVTVEPGVYVPGVGGVRIEDSVIVTDTGCEPITQSTKDRMITGVVAGS